MGYAGDSAGVTGARMWRLPDKVWGGCARSIAAAYESGRNGTYLSAKPRFPSFLRKQESSGFSHSEARDSSFRWDDELKQVPFKSGRYLL